MSPTCPQTSNDQHALAFFTIGAFNQTDGVQPENSESLMGGWRRAASEVQQPRAYSFTFDDPGKTCNKNQTQGIFQCRQEKTQRWLPSGRKHGEKRGSLVLLARSLLSIPLQTQPITTVLCRQSALIGLCSNTLAIIISTSSHRRIPASTTVRKHHRRKHHREENVERGIEPRSPVVTVGHFCILFSVVDSKPLERLPRLPCNGVVQWSSRDGEMVAATATPSSTVTPDVAFVHLCFCLPPILCFLTTLVAGLCACHHRPGSALLSLT